MSTGLKYVGTLPPFDPIGHIVLLCNGPNVMVRNINLPDDGTRKGHLKTFRECLVTTIFKIVENDRDKINKSQFTLHLSKVVLGNIVLKETLRQLCMYTEDSNTYVFKTENLFPTYLKPRELSPEDKSTVNPYNPFTSSQQLLTNPFTSSQQPSTNPFTSSLTNPFTSQRLVNNPFLTPFGKGQSYPKDLFKM